VTAVDPSPRPLPEIGQSRFARDVRMGWHILWDGRWHLVDQAFTSQASGRVQLVLHEGIHDQRQLPMRGTEPLMTRTPAEQIAHVEALRLEQPVERGGGPVARLHYRQQWDRAIAEESTEGGADA